MNSTKNLHYVKVWWLMEKSSVEWLQMEGKITRDVVQDVVNEVPELLVSGEDNPIFLQFPHS
jgi:hypothetical protein